MKFPGTNKLTLPKDTVIQIVAAELAVRLGSDVRITDTTWRLYDSEVEIAFTTDPDPEKPLAPPDVDFP